MCVCTYTNVRDERWEKRTVELTEALLLRRMRGKDLLLGSMTLGSGSLQEKKPIRAHRTDCQAP